MGNVSLFGGGNSYSNQIKSGNKAEENFYSKAPLNFHAYDKQPANTAPKNPEKTGNAYLDMYM